MGFWSYDLWGSDDAFEFLRDVLIMAGVLPTGAFPSPGILMYESTVGRRYVGRMKVSNLDAIKELMDTVLTASHVEALAPRLSLRVRNSEERDACHFWAPLCMHVGAAVPSEAFLLALVAFEEGFWAGDVPARAKLAAAYSRELRVYDAARHSGAVRFPTEMLSDILSSPNGSRYFRYTARGGENAPIASWDVLVEYTCCACGLPATALCSRCKRTRYCGALCQSTHWRGAHKAVCKEDASARKR